MNKILGNNYPVITSYPHHACLFTILSDYEDTWLNMLGYYIQLVYDIDNIRMDFSIAMNFVEFLEYQQLLDNFSVNREILDGFGIPGVQWVEKAIEREFYVFTLLNRYYIPADHINLKKINLLHDTMIYGYDNNKRELYAADFLNHGRYAYFTISYDDFEKAFVIGEEDDWFRGVRLLRVRRYLHCGLNYRMDVIKELLEGFLDGRSTHYSNLYDYEQKRKPGLAIGIQIYDALLHNLKQLEETGADCDIRGYHILFDHKKILWHIVNRLNHLRVIKNYNHYQQELRILVNSAEQLRNLVLRYNLTKEAKILRRVQEHVEILRDREGTVLAALKEDIRLTSDVAVSFKESVKLCGDADVKCSKYWYEKKTDNSACLESKMPEQTIRFNFYGTRISICGSDDLEDSDMAVMIDGDEKEYERSCGKLTIENLTRGYHCALVTTRKKKAGIQKFIFGEDLSFQEVGAKCKVLGCDTETTGAWKRNYGQKGYHIVGEKIVLPHYMIPEQYAFYNAGLVLVTCNINIRPEAMEQSVNSNKIEAYWLSGTKFGIGLLIPGNDLREVTFYMADYERFGRKAALEIWDADKNQLLYESPVYGLVNGLYVTYALRGNIRIDFICKEGPNVVVSGIFFNS